MYHFQTRNGVMKFSHTWDIWRWGSVTFNIVQHILLSEFKFHSSKDKSELSY